MILYVYTEGLTLSFSPLIDLDLSDRVVANMVKNFAGIFHTLLLLVYTLVFFRPMPVSQFNGLSKFMKNALKHFQQFENKLTVQPMKSGLSRPK